MIGRLYREVFRHKTQAIRKARSQKGEAMTDMKAKAREYLQKPYRGPREAFIAGYRAGYEEHREQTKGNFAALTTTAIGEFKTKHFNEGMEEAAEVADDCVTQGCACAEDIREKIND